MGTVYAEITLENVRDVFKSDEGTIEKTGIRTLNVTALVDTGATTLVLNDEIRNKLGLSIEETRTVGLAGGAKTECGITEPVRIRWKNRRAVCNAFVFPDGDPLLGVIPLEFMDLIVDPVRKELAGAHGDEIVSLVM